jgi:hypothetical protein
MTTTRRRTRTLRTAGFTTIAVTGRPKEAVAKARALASLVEVTAMRHRLANNRPGPFGPLDQPVIRIDVTYRTPARRTR